MKANARDTKKTYTFVYVFFVAPCVGYPSSTSSLRSGRQPTTHTICNIVVHLHSRSLNSLLLHLLAFLLILLMSAVRLVADNRWFIYWNKKIFDLILTLVIKIKKIYTLCISSLFWLLVFDTRYCQIHFLSQLIGFSPYLCEFGRYWFCQSLTKHLKNYPPAALLTALLFKY